MLSEETIGGKRLGERQEGHGQRRAEAAGRKETSWRRAAEYGTKCEETVGERGASLAEERKLGREGKRGRREGEAGRGFAGSQKLADKMGRRGAGHWRLKAGKRGGSAELKLGCWFETLGGYALFAY